MGILVEVANQKTSRVAAHEASRFTSTVEAIEGGGIVVPSAMSFTLLGCEEPLVSTRLLKPYTKNISFDPHCGLVRGAAAESGRLDALQPMLRRFSEWALRAMMDLVPHYRERLQMGMTSFRPADIAGRVSSWRKDDTRLHIDAFPSRPLQGRRIVRLFANVGRSNRRWLTGDPFDQVARKFLPRIPAPLPGSLWLREKLHLTRGSRTLYDHYMLAMHDSMKRDIAYQAQVRRTSVEFQPGAVWACFTDLVSHAAVAGQFALEQTFYLPVNAMQDPVRSPLLILERILGRSLV